MDVVASSLFPELDSGLSPKENLASDCAIRRLPTNTTTYKHPIHRWYNFIAGFDPNFAYSCVAEAGTSDGLLLDPFAGCGTSLVAANARSWNAIGYEAHPVFVRVGRAKACSCSQAEQMVEIEQILMRGFANPICPQSGDL